MKKVFVILMLLLLGCNANLRPEKPDNLIAKEKMADILFDVYVLTSAKGINKQTLESNGIFPKEYVYEKYGIDSLQFAMSNDYYAYDTGDYEEILDLVQKKVDRQKELVEAKIERETKEKDSIKKANREKIPDSIRMLKKAKLDSLPKGLIKPDSLK